MNDVYDIHRLPDGAYRLDPLGRADDETAVGLRAALATGLDPDGVGTPVPVVMVAVPGNGVEFPIITPAARALGDLLHRLADQADEEAQR